VQFKIQVVSYYHYAVRGPIATLHDHFKLTGRN